MNMEIATKQMHERVHVTGKQIKFELMQLLEEIYASDDWRGVIDPRTCMPFTRFTDWLCAGYPVGPAVGRGRYALTLDDLVLFASRKMKPVLQGRN